jgi:hypothetical protein
LNGSGPSPLTKIDRHELIYNVNQTTNRGGGHRDKNVSFNHNLSKNNNLISSFDDSLITYNYYKSIDSSFNGNENTTARQEQPNDEKNARLNDRKRRDELYDATAAPVVNLDSWWRKQKSKAELSQQTKAPSTTDSNWNFAKEPDAPPLSPSVSSPDLNQPQLKPSWPQPPRKRNWNYNNVVDYRSKPPRPPPSYVDKRHSVHGATLNWRPPPLDDQLAGVGRSIAPRPFDRVEEVEAEYAIYEERVR